MSHTQCWFDYSLLVKMAHELFDTNKAFDYRVPTHQEIFWLIILAVKLNIRSQTVNDIYDYCYHHN